MNILTVFNDDSTRDLNHNFYCRDFMSWDVYNFLEIKPKLYYLTISDNNENGHFFTDAYKRFYRKEQDPDFTFISIEELKENINILENSVVFFYTVPFLIKNEIYPEKIILVDDVLYEKSFVNEETELLEEYHDYINKIPDVTLYVSNNVFCDYLKQIQKDGILRNNINIIHLPVKFDFNRIQGITNNSTNKIITGLDNDICLDEIINLLNNKTINLDMLGLHSTHNTERYSEFLKELLKNPVYLENFRKVKHRINKYDVKNIQDYDIFYFFRYGTGYYNFAVRSFWEFLYLGKGVYFKHEDEDYKFHHGDGITHYMQNICDMKNMDIKTLFNRILYVEKEIISEIFTMDENYALLQYFR